MISPQINATLAESSSSKSCPLKKIKAMIIRFAFGNDSNDDIEHEEVGEVGGEDNGLEGVNIVPQVDGDGNDNIEVDPLSQGQTNDQLDGFVNNTLPQVRHNDEMTILLDLPNAMKR
jgi:hypothetical protein